MKPGDPANTEGNLLDPAVLQTLESLELVARRVVDGYLQGMHRSPHVGFAMDFARHRPYAPGDDIKRIDWRAFARTERFYIKQHEVSTNLRAHVLLDASGSMGYRGANDPASKLRYGQFIAACLSYLILNQGDSAGLMILGSRAKDAVAPASAPSHLARLISTIEKSKPGDESAIGPLLHEAASAIRGRGMVIVISDLFDDVKSLIGGLHHLRHRGHEVLLIHVMSHDELEFPFRTWTTFENLERSDDRRRVDPAIMRQQYLENMRRHLRAIADAAEKLEIHYQLMETSRPVDAALAAYLSRRA